MSNLKIELKNQLEENINLHKNILKMSKDIVDVINDIYKKLKKGGKILFCGNGGSAADAQHLAAEFLVRLTSDVNREGLPAISLAQDTSTLTACLNDYGADNIFKRVFSSLAQDRDILLAISTSGNSSNIIETLKLAKSKGIYSLGFLGGDGGKALQYCDNAFIVPSKVTARIQESHITAGHAVLQYVEDRLLKEGWLHKE